MTIYVIRDDRLVEKTRAAPISSGTNVMSDIATFVTQEGIPISSRSELRAYEQKTGSRQCGNDWPGSEKPSWWNSTLKRRREI